MRRAEAESVVKGLRRAPKPESVPDTQVDLAQIRSQITQAVGRRAVRMVDSAMDEVEGGHYLAMKYLFEIAGLYPSNASVESTEEDSLSKILLRNLGVDPDVAQMQTKVLNDSPKGWNPAARDAVE